MAGHHHHGHHHHHHHDIGHHATGSHDVEHRDEGAGHVGAGPAVLDIGGDVGALVARMDDGTAGTELYLRPDHDPPTTVHTGVWQRLDAGLTLTVAVFPELRAGSYRVLDDGGNAVRAVEIRGGAVATIDLRLAAADRVPTE